MLLIMLIMLVMLVMLLIKLLVMIWSWCGHAAVYDADGTVDHAVARAAIQVAEQEYGSPCGKPPVGFILRLVDSAREEEDRFLLATKLNISAAFDTAWRPWILGRLVRSGCAGDLFVVLKSYLTDRRVVFRFQQFSVSRNLTLGVP